ncbi:hypothetical protein LCGC14_1857670 [marine sediment metagenome]|uniref:Uncharacterized protein n=1 Tax=marine sediment metagenome TaxID=412755 RepID=A0A0F9G8T6_9ZZZZ
MENDPQALEKKPSLFRFVQFDAAIESIESQIVEAVEEDHAVPDSTLDKLSKYLMLKVEHIDHVVRWLHHCTAQIKFLRSEEELLRTQRKRAEKGFGEIRQYLQDHVDLTAEGEDKDKPRLEGPALKMWTQVNGQPGVDIDDKSLVPEEYYDLTITIRTANTAAGREVAAVVQDFVENYDSQGVEVNVSEPGLNAIRLKEALVQGVAIPGASLHYGRHLRTSSPRKIAETMVDVPPPRGALEAAG